MLKKNGLRNLLHAMIIILMINVYTVSAEQIPSKTIQEKLSAIEAVYGGKIGLYVLNTANNTVVHYRGKERFPLCSTAKVMTVAAILKKDTKTNNFLQQKLTYTENEVNASGYAPITKQYQKQGMTIKTLCKAAIIHSDNAAMNILTKKLGGPSAITAFARSIGDSQFRLDRLEPNLNTAIPGDLRDTSTPEAMAKSLQKLIFGDVLTVTSQIQLLGWLKNNTTGNARIRAGVPKNWLVADKTGTGSYGTTNDIGIIWSPHKPPFIVSIYYTQNEKNASPRDDIIASVTRILSHTLI